MKRLLSFICVAGMILIFSSLVVHAQDKVRAALVST